MLVIQRWPMTTRLPLTSSRPRISRASTSPSICSSLRFAFEVSKKAARFQPSWRLQEILNVDITFDGRVPYAMMLLRSADGVDFQPYEVPYALVRFFYSCLIVLARSTLLLTATSTTYPTTGNLCSPIPPSAILTALL